MTGAEPGAHPPGGGGGGGMYNGGMHPFGAAFGGGGRGGFVFEEDIDADEIFRMFFGGNPFMGAAAQTVFGNVARQQQQHARYRQAQQQQHGNGAGGADTNLLKLFTSLFPLLLIILLQVFSGPSRPPFSLHQTRHHPAPMATATHQVPFYVKSAAEFAAKYPPGSRERSRVEMTAEGEWKQGMQQACYQERLLKRRYEYYGQAAKAAQVKLNSCEELARKFGGQAASAS